LCFLLLWGEKANRRESGKAMGSVAVRSSKSWQQETYQQPDLCLSCYSGLEAFPKNR
jgi:hypothetical protein